MSKKAKRHDQILLLLKGREESSALKISDLCEQLDQAGFGVDVRTVRRDIEEMSTEYGILGCEGYPERYYLSSDFHFKHQVMFTDEELQVLMISLNNLKHTSDKYFQSMASQVENSILKNLPIQTVATLRQEKEKYFYDFSISGKPESSSEKDFKLLMEALRRNKQFSCKNISPYKDHKKQERMRYFSPYKFVLTAGIPYLLVQDVEDKQIKRLRLNRVKEVKILDAQVDVKLKVNWDKYTVESLGGYGGADQKNEDVVIICDQTMAFYFQEKTIHSSQKMAMLDENKYKLTFKVPLSFEFIRLISSFLPHILDIQNVGLKEQILTKVSQALRTIKKAA
jgi:predicted DNA-binding transcriptional regulator YafY